MDDQEILDLPDEQWRSVPQIRSKAPGISGYNLTTALHRLAVEGRVEMSALPTLAIRRGRNGKAVPMAIEMFRLCAH